MSVRQRSEEPADGSVNVPANRWPGACSPTNSPVLARNEIRTGLSPERIWPVLIDAVAWPRWYANARDVVLESGHDRLADGLTFRWVTFGMRITSTVDQFVPARRLGWSGKGLGSAGYHRWELTPTGDGGCLIVTEEVQQGLLARLLAPLVRRSIERQHQKWLEGLVRTAAA